MTEEDPGRLPLRWRLVVDEPSTDALFPNETVLQHHVGTGEYRGMEFFEVNAKKIINRVPAASRMPFQYTINAYRGCSHACAYCTSGDTPVLMGDGRTKPIADVVKGDVIYGTQRIGAYRRYVRTEVVDHWSTIKSPWRITLADGTELIASADHRFLTDRGWKHVTGSEKGRDRRPHLTENNRLIGTGQFVHAPVDTWRYRLGYLTGMIRGDATIGHYEYQLANRVSRIHGFRLALVDDEALARAREFLLGAGLEFRPDRVFQKRTQTRKQVMAFGTGRRDAVEFIERLIEWPQAVDDDWAQGFLAGIFDAEGHFGQVVRISNSDPMMLAMTEQCSARLGFRTVLEPPNANGCRNVRLVGGLTEVLRFFHTVGPAITRKMDIEGRALKNVPRLGVVDIEPLGGEMPMYDITTGTGDFIANGVVSHNCFARPTHEYLGFNTGEDFDSKIVAKVNAVERARAEVSARRWAGHHIAMGTNTDPYQKAEGKYHLTRGIIEILGQARNPFSILTKSTLVLRDLDALTAAARRTDVRLNFSIGTLDREVWKLTEPGTPPPDKRVDAVRRLNQAGIPCGVLIAPILPALSDSDEQLQSVVDACVRAGAVSITAIALHLRPGVSEHYLAWLEEHRPDLMPLYVRLFTGRKGPRSYQPSAVQDDLSARVQRMVRAAEDRFGTPRVARDVNPYERVDPSPPEPVAEQLTLL